jgi:hypothetical protein
MKFVSRRPKLKLSEEEVGWRERRSQSRSEPAGRVERAEILLGYCTEGLGHSRRTPDPSTDVERCMARTLEPGGTRGAAGPAGPRPPSALECRSPDVGGGAGLPETPGVGLRAGTVGHR